eukprot:TRINITY_DN7756_c0_g1_i1.p4 TRINITY_DN7756_c0_g1~~TRINITY_DN7756_c0_g1_i1.p4  ORF type:complete len:125 (+),score=20.98 TRINITY_DN7756_c0_g1_i1:278-652(+)
MGVPLAPGLHPRGTGDGDVLRVRGPRPPQLPRPGPEAMRPTQCCKCGAYGHTAPDCEGPRSRPAAKADIEREGPGPRKKSRKEQREEERIDKQAQSAAMRHLKDRGFAVKGTSRGTYAAASIPV